jgi:hypothetical protein
LDSHELPREMDKEMPILSYDDALVKYIFSIHDALHIVQITTTPANNHALDLLAIIHVQLLNMPYWQSK